MDFISKNLAIIAECIQTSTYKEVETDRFELKDLSAGWGHDWYKSVCAFLNTNGGVVVIGIKDVDNPPKGQAKTYKFMGYDNSKSNENHLKQELPKKFTSASGNILDSSLSISYEIRDFLDGKIAIVYIEELNAEYKHAFYEGKAYTRKITGDHEISTLELERYEEIKREIIQNRELEVIKEANLTDLDVNILNKYINKFNEGKKRGETLKTSIDAALPFLQKENFVRDRQPTLLGMLVCASEPERYIQGKCEANCYVVIADNTKIDDDREIIEDNIVELIERSNNFIRRNIRIGTAYTNGGTATPEYPESLIRESINNAFAHRDYRSNRFVIVEIRPQESLMIRNPGLFERRQRINEDTVFGKIRRIIPLQVARNPKLTHLLKSFRYWEGKGRGLTSLIDACLDNEIDVPYYILSQDEIRLYIPKGKVYDDEAKSWLDGFSGYIQRKIGRELTEEEKIMLAFFRKSEMLNRVEKYTILITADNNHANIIATLEELDLIFKNAKSPELYPIYQVDRTLMKSDFSQELKLAFGKDWDMLKYDYQETLQVLYLYNNFGSSLEIASANSVGTYLYLKKYKIIKNISEFDNFKRKIRNIFNQLENKKFISRKDGKTKESGGKPDFKINDNYQALQTLFV